MWKRKLFNRLLQQRDHIREKTAAYCAKHPKRVIVAMFAILVICFMGLLLGRESQKGTAAVSVEKLYSDLNGGQRPALRPQASLMPDLLKLASIYDAAMSIDPDSLTPADTLLIKSIDKQLNDIIHEKP